MTRKPDDKGLLNEVLPDPSHAVDARRGTPRERTTQHLRHLLAAAAGLALGAGAGAHADNSVPGKQPPDKGTKSGGKSGKPKAKPEEPRPYLVVDPVPEPYVERKEAPGFLSVQSTPPAQVSVDGKPTGNTTPLKKLGLSPGMHTVTLRTADGVEQHFTVEIKSGATTAQVRDLRPAASPPPAPKAPSK